MAGVTLLLALRAAGGADALGDTLNTKDGRAPDTLSLGRIQVELTDGALGAHALHAVEEGTRGAGDALVVDNDLSGIAAVALLEADGIGVQDSPGQGVVHILKIKNVIRNKIKDIFIMK